jgi:hypothetical protein
VANIELILLMSSLFYLLSTTNVLSSWVRVVAIWKNGQENGIGVNKGLGRVGGTTENNGDK